MSEHLSVAMRSRSVQVQLLVASLLTVHGKVWQQLADGWEFHSCYGWFPLAILLGIQNEIFFIVEQNTIQINERNLSVTS